MLTFVDQRSHYRQQFFGDFSFMYQYFWHNPPHTFEYAEYHTITLGCQLTPENYPFDSHECSMKFYNPERTTKTLLFLPSLLETQKEMGLNKLRIDNHGLNFDVSVESLPTNEILIHGYAYSTAGLMFKFQRNKLWTIITGYYLPTGLYSMLSGLSFTIQREQLAGRMGMMVTLSLISTNSYNSLDAPEDRGISFLEIWMLGTHFPVLFAIVEYGVILSMDKSKADMKDYMKWDNISLLIFTCYQIIFQFMYWYAASGHM